MKAILLYILLIICYFVPLIWFLKKKLKWIPLLLSAFFIYGAKILFDLSIYDAFLLVCTIFLIHTYYKGTLPYKVKEDRPLKIMTMFYLMPVVLFGKFFAGALAQLSTVVFDYYHLSYQEAQQVVTELSHHQGLMETILSFLSVCVVAPVTEEYSIRYFLNGYLFQTKFRLHVIVSAIISSLIFASLHDSLPGIVNAFFAGLMFSWIYQKFGLRYSVLSHGLFNLVSYLAIKMYGG